MAEHNPLSTTAAAPTAQERTTNHTRSSLLGLPAELRNRIYYFADEGAHEVANEVAGKRAHEVAGEHIPLLARRGTKQWPIEDYTRSYRKFYGLTQVCRQVRAEYLPIWTRTSFVRILPKDFASFVTTFFGDEHIIYGPKLLELSHKDPLIGTALQLHTFIKFRIAHPNTEFQFVSHDLINWSKTYGSKPRRRRGSTTTYSGFNCRTCGHKYEGRGSPMCEHQDHTFWHRKSFIGPRDAFLRKFSQIVNYDNKKFEDEMTGGSITCIYSWYSSGVVIGLSRMPPDPLEACPVGIRNNSEWEDYFEEMGIDSSRFSLSSYAECNCGPEYRFRCFRLPQEGFPSCLHGLASS